MTIGPSQRANQFLNELIGKRRKLIEALDANKGEVNLDIFEDFYPDRAHFVYELLQNAEDAHATWVTFTLKQDCLVCEHDGRRTFNEADVSDKPSWIRALPLMSAADISASDAIHRNQLESLQAVDRGIATIIATLQNEGRWNNTLLIFSSDNGYSWGEHRLRDRKRCPYEECIRVPFWVRSPGVVARSDTNIVANIDIAPTVAAWAGITPPGTVNGANLMPLLQNAATPWRQEILIEHLGDIPSLTSSAVRSHQYLYNEYVNGGKEFYELNTDPFQLTNTVTKPSNAAIIAALQATLVQLKAQ